jgi:ferredoxin
MVTTGSNVVTAQARCHHSRDAGKPHDRDRDIRDRDIRDRDARNRRHRTLSREVLLRVEVDRDACESNGVCAGLAPEVFALDDDDELHILVADVPARLDNAVRHAVGSCPKAALRLSE